MNFESLLNFLHSFNELNPEIASYATIVLIVFLLRGEGK